MRLFIAQNPSVGLAIAQLVGATNRAVGAWSGPGVMVSWALSHLVSIAPAQQHGFADDWSADSLPIFPQELTLAVLTGSGYATQFNVLKSLIQRAERIVCAMDACREGELLFWSIYHLAGGTAPCDRLRVSSLTSEALTKGLATLQPISAVDGLYLAAKCRAEADWLVGMNLTRAMTVQHRHSQKIIRVSRLQSPALSLIAERYEAHSTFTPSAYYQPQLTVIASPLTATPFAATYSLNLPSAEQATAVLTKHLASNLIVLSSQQKTVVTPPPTLLHLTLAQRLANDQFGYSAAHTAGCLQTLYERAHITCPRTDNAFLPDDQREPVRCLLEHLSRGSMQRQAVARQPSDRPFQSGNGTDHHALLPTLHRPDLSLLSEGERNLYNLIVDRLFMAFAAPKQELHTRLLIGTDLSQSGESGCFVATSSVVVNPGYSALDKRCAKMHVPSEKAKDPVALPDLPIMTRLTVVAQSCRRGTTTAPPLLTESTLLSLLESGGHPRQSPEEVPLEPALAKFSLGTPATRADTIETLLRQQYIERKQRALVPTPFGQSVWLLLRDLPVGQPQTTGKWEYALRKIEQQQLEPGEFMGHLRQMITRSIEAIVGPGTQPVVAGDTLRCPACKKGTLGHKGQFYGCSAYTEGCQFTLPTQLLGKPITPHLLRSLVLTGTSPVINGFTGKKGPFDARLELAPGVAGKLGLHFVFARK